MAALDVSRPASKTAEINVVEQILGDLVPGKSFAIEIAGGQAFQMRVAHAKELALSILIAGVYPPD
jgi:hypothetical protein